MPEELKPSPEALNFFTEMKGSVAPPKEENQNEPPPPKEDNQNETPPPPKEDVLDLGQRKPKAKATQEESHAGHKE